MKNLLQKMFLVASLGLIGFSTYAQYRTEHYYNEKYDGAEFKPNTDSFRFYFSGSNNWKSSFIGVDLSDYFANMYIKSVSGEYELPKYPEVYPGNVFGSVDSAQTFDPTSSGDGYGALSGRNICTRDANGDVTEYLSRVYSGGSWTNNSREIYTFSSHKITEKIKQDWSGGAWVNSYRELATYNSSGKITEYTQMTWTAGAWVGSYKYLYDYDAAGNCTSVIYKSYSGGTYVNVDRTLNTYSSSNKLVESVISNWSAGAWADDIKYLITYNSAGQMDVVTVQNMVGGSWEDFYRYSYFYSSGKKSGSLVEQYTGGIWEKKYKASYTYSGAGKIKEVIRSDWIIADSDWGNSQKLTLNYDANNNISNFINEFWNTGGYWEKTTSSYMYHFIHSPYSSTEIQELQNQVQIQLYPNPTSQNLNVKISWKIPQAAALTIIDINGRVLLTQDLEAVSSLEKTIDVSSFSNGTYFLQISNNNGRINQSFQVVK